MLASKARILDTPETDLMDQETRTVLTPRVVFADEYAGYRPPRVPVSSDRDGASFRWTATLEVPKLLYLLEHPGVEGAFTHLAVDVQSPFVSEHQDWEIEVGITIDGTPFDKRLYHKCYTRHQFLIPLPVLRFEKHQITVNAVVARTGVPTDDQPEHKIQLCLISQPRLWAELEKRSVWVYSTARSGSTWLTHDVLCADIRARPVDESGIGRMFAPLQWDAERFFDAGTRNFYIESGFPFEIGEKQRPRHGLPVFQRSFANLDLENQILSRHNFDFYHEMLRDVTFGHVLNEWGLLGYPRVVFKMPNDSHGADFIMRAFPGSHMVFMMRDGRDVMRSRFSPFASRALATTANRDLRRFGIFYYSHLWNFQLDIIRSAFEGHASERRILVYYEQLRTDPVRVITELYQHLSMPGTPQEIASLAERTRLENVPAAERGPDKPRQNGIVGGFRQVFDEEEIALMNAIMGPNLTRYGYDL
jgi:hypothetical protein